MNTLSIIGIILGLAILVYGSMKGYSVFISAILGSAVMALLSGISLNDALLDSFVTGMTGFIKGNFMVFAAGALMGKAFEITHGAKAIARLFIKLFGQTLAPYAVLLSIIVMTWGGIAGFVLAFSVFPIALEVFRESNLPREIVPGIIVAGCCTASSWGPGTAQPVNAVMANGFGVSLMAAAVPSFIMAFVAVATSFLIMSFIFKKARADGRGFVARETDAEQDTENLPNGWIALVPLAVALILINVKIGGAPILPTAFGIAVGAALAVALMFKYRTDDIPLTKHVGAAFGNALTSIGNTAAMVAVGSVAQTTGGFQTVLNAVTGIGGSPLIGASLAGLIVAFICGGATGATGLLGPLLTPVYTSMGANMEMVGRIVMASGHVTGTLPNGGFINTVITGIAKDTYKNCFKYSFLICTCANLVAVIVGIIIMTAMGAFV